MKRKMSAILVGVMLMAGLPAYGMVPEVISAPVNEVKEEAVPFEVKQDGDDFTIILEANPSTGFSWSYEISKPDHVQFEGESFIQQNTDLVGAPGEAAFSFKVLGEGVSTIVFSYEQPWVGEAEKTLRVLVYKNGDKVYVEEDQKVSIMDGATDMSNETIEMYYNDQLIDTELKVVKINGIAMLPLSPVLKAMDYDVKWNGETQSVEILKGAQWTSIKIGENAYFRNRMAPWELSSAPIIQDSRTFVPVEFMVDILGKGLMVEMGDLKFNDFEPAIHSGYVHSIAYDETGTMSITISSVEGSDDVMNHTVIHTSKAYTYYQKEVVEGALIRVVSPLVMTLSIPGQTSGYIIY